MVDSVPLTIRQKVQLVAWLLLLGFAPAVFIGMFIAERAFPPVILLLLVGFMIYVWVLQALRCLRDLRLGVALVEEDLLVGKSKGFRSFPAGEFARLGRLTLTVKAYNQGRPNWTHRVTYSPANNLVWTLEPLASQPSSRKGRAHKR